MAVFKGSSVRYYDSTNQKFVKIQGSQTTGSDYTLQLPPNVGGADQVLKLPSAISDTNQLVWGDAGGSSSQTVVTLAPQGTDATTTSQAIYGVNVINTATQTAFATRLPDASTGKQVTFVNTSELSILVFPSVTGGKINGVVDGYASIPNDGASYTFTCVQNPLPGAWVWSPPAVNQIQLGRISVPSVNGVGVGAWSTGQTDASGNLVIATGMSLTPWFNNTSVFNNGSWNNPVTFPITTNDQGLTSGEKIWLSVPALTPARTITAIKIYSNFLETDTTVPGFGTPTIQRYVGYSGGAGINLTTAQGNPLFGGQVNPTGPLNSPVQIGDRGTVFTITPLPPGGGGFGFQTNLIGNNNVGAITDPGYGLYFHTFNIGIPSFCITKTYEFDIFIEHT